MARQKKIRATIITGYLGAGKTTLINNLLRKYNKSTFALVENEFGEVAVDSHLIRGIDASRLFELKNGCICCTITQEYELVLNELAEKYPHIGELLIETTGIADPGEIIKPFIHDPEIRSTYEFCGIICVADVVRTSENLSKNAVWQQIAMAGAVVISKTEQMSPEEIQAFTRELSKVNPFAPCFLSQRNGTTVVLSDFWNNRARTLQLAIQDKPIHEEISSRTVRIEQPPDRKKFEKWLDYTLDVNKKYIYRLKGIVYFRDEPFEYIIQAVGNSWEITEGDYAMEKSSGVLVVIGNLKNVDLRWEEDQESAHSP